MTARGRCPGYVVRGAGGHGNGHEPTVGQAEGRVRGTDNELPPQVAADGPNRSGGVLPGVPRPHAIAKVADPGW